MANNFLNFRNGINIGGLSSAPSNPKNGDMYYDTSLGLLQIYENGTWGSLYPNSINALTGDVLATGGGSVVATIAAGAVSLSKMANLAANSLIGNNTGSSATPQALTSTQVTAMLNLFTTSLQGLAPASGGGSVNFLRADGTWALPPGIGVTTVGAFSPTSETNGALISGPTITFGPADGTNPGMVSTTTQTLAGAKTFTGNFAASALSVFGSGTIDVQSILAVAGGSQLVVGNPQNGVSVASTFTANGSVANLFRAVPTLASTAAATAVRSFYAAPASLAGGATASYLVDFRTSNPTAGVNNASFADNESFSGNWFINNSTNVNSTLAGIVTLTNATASSSVSSGALVVSGGIGIGGAAHIALDIVGGANADITNTVNASNFNGANSIANTSQAIFNADTHVITQTSNGTYYVVGYAANSDAPAISTGVTNLGYYIGADIYGLRALSADLGTLAELSGVNITYGHNTGIGSTASTTNAFGIVVAPILRAGTIGTSYAMYVAPAQFGATITNQHFGLYIDDQGSGNTALRTNSGQVLFGGNVTVGGTSSLTMNGGQILVPDGTNLLPSYSFTNGADYGMFLEGGSAIAFSAAGTIQFTLSETGYASFVNTQVQFPDGTAAIPSISFGNQNTLGLFRVTGNVLGVAVGGSQVAEFAAAGLTLTNLTPSTSLATNSSNFIVSVPSIFNVVLFGAVGDGTTDDTVAIQAAVTAAQNAGGGVYFPPGTAGYIISDTITVSNDCAIFGDSMTASSSAVNGATIIFSGTNAVPMFLIDNNGGSFRMSHLSLKNNGSATMGIQINRVNTVIDNICSNSGTLFSTAVISTYQASGYTYHVTVKDCFFAVQDITSQTPIGILFAGGHTFVIDGCMFSGYPVAGVKLEAAGGGSGGILGCSITNTHIEAFDGSTVGYPGSNTAVGLYVSGPVYGLNVTGCNFQMNGNGVPAAAPQRAITLAGVQGANICGNDFLGTGGAGSSAISIATADSTGIWIAGNSMYDYDLCIEVLNGSATYQVGINDYHNSTTPVLVYNSAYAANTALITDAQSQVITSSTIPFTILQSNTSNPAASGSIRLSRPDFIAWRNNANSGDVILASNSADELNWTGLGGFSTSVVDIRLDQNANSQSLVRNESAGASAGTSLGVGSNADLLSLSVSSIAGGANAELSAGPGFTGGLTINVAANAPLLFRTNSSPVGSISGAGLWSIGYSGAPQTHIVNGNLQITGLTPSRLVETDGSNNLVSSAVSASSLEWLDNAEALQSFTLADNQSAVATIESWVAATFSRVIVDYSINRNGSFEGGSIQLITDGASVGLSQNTAIVGGSTGITFSATISGANLLLQYASTSTGHTGTLKYTIRKWLA